MTSTFEKIAASVPVNSTAARQMGRGVEFAPGIQLQDYMADLPQMRGADYYQEKMRDPGDWIDFRGSAFGRLTVIGVRVKERKQASWICRCKCGAFCSRSAKSLKVADRGGNSFVDRCGRCDYERRLISGEIARCAPAKAWNIK